MPTEKEVWMDIIETYRNMPFLWDKTNQNYMNRDIRQEEFTILLQKYRLFDELPTLLTLKKKLENMRTSYNRELKKVKASKQSGSGSKDTYVPSLWYFDLFGFLVENNEPCRQGMETLDDSVEGSHEATTPESYNEETSSQKLPGRKPLHEVPPDTEQSKHNKRQNKCSENNNKEYLLNKAASLLDKKEEEWKIIGKSLGLQLSRVDSQQSIIAHKLISDVLFYAKMGKLSEESTISLKAEAHPSQKYNYPFPQHQNFRRDTPSSMFHNSTLISISPSLLSPQEMVPPSALANKFCQLQSTCSSSSCEADENRSTFLQGPPITTPSDTSKDNMNILDTTEDTDF